MLHQRILVLYQYITSVISGTRTETIFTDTPGQVPIDQSMVRQISSVAASLPSMNAKAFQDEFQAVSNTGYKPTDLQEYADVQLTTYLTKLVEQLSALNDASPERVCNR